MPAYEELEASLRKLHDSERLYASAVVSKDGFIILSNIPKKIHEETFAVMSATMIGAAETTMSELKKGPFRKIYVHSENGKIIATEAGPKAILVAVIDSDADIGKIEEKMDVLAREIEESL